LAVLRDEVKAAIIIIGSVLVLSVVVVLIGGTKLFARYDTYYTKVANAAGLEVGAQVRIGGVRSGRVLDIQAPMDPGEKVTIVIGVKEGTPLFKGTTARITQIGFVGDIYLLLSVKSIESGRVEPGSTIPSVEPVEFSELMAELGDLSDSLDKLIKDVDRMFSEENVKGFEELIENTNSAMVNASASIGTMTAGFKETTERIQAMMDDIEVFVKEGGDLDEIFEQAKTDLDAAEEMIHSFENSAQKIGDASDAVGGAVGRQDRNLDEVMGNLNDTMRDLQDLLQTLKLKPWSVVHKEEKPKEE
jgi:phospholipid/cholesterol/gamma-HCH transport system substrate-binding protein